MKRKIKRAMLIGSVIGMETAVICYLLKNKKHYYDATVLLSFSE